MEKKKRIITYFIVLLGVCVIGVSYALWMVTRTQSSPSIVESGCFSMEYIFGEAITMEGAFPVTDEEGIENDPYTFTVKNTCSIAASVDIKLLVTDASTMNLSHIKASLTGDAVVRPKILSTFSDGTTETPHIATVKVLTNQLIEPYSTQSFDLKLWMDESVTKEEEHGSTFLAKVEISASATKTLYRDESGAEYPDFDNGMIPVMYNGTDWVKADLYEKWYDYKTLMWANAVSVSEATRTEYEEAPAGTPIKMADILFMWVWIPRYEYQTYNLANKYGTGSGGSSSNPRMSVKFISKDTMVAPTSNFAIHDAFWWDDNNNGVKEVEEQLAGIWVAKFEISPSRYCGLSSYENSGCDLKELFPRSKPNETSWRGARVGTFYTAIKNSMNGETGRSEYGLVDADTHMMKNMEWGAVAYLSLSLYGKRWNTSFDSDDREIYVNNNSNYVTGCSAGASWRASSYNGCEYAYDVDIQGTGASTTGTIYGIYDMSGGAKEYVMSFLKAKDSDQFVVGEDDKYNSGFSGKLVEGGTFVGEYGDPTTIEKKYYDLYEASDEAYDFSSRYHPGDATYETSSGDGKSNGWYGDSSALVNESPSSSYEMTAMNRGGTFSNGSSSGIFAFHAYNGFSIENHTTRVTSINHRIEQ